MKVALFVVVICTGLVVVGTQTLPYENVPDSSSLPVLVGGSLVSVIIALKKLHNRDED